MDQQNNNKRKLNTNENNYNKRSKRHFNKDNDVVKYIIKCTKNNTKLLEDLKYNFKSNEISDFSERLKKYILKREKIEKEYRNKIFEQQPNEEYEKQNEVILNENNKNKNEEPQISNKNKSSNSINFVFTDNNKNLEEILIIKPINEINEINEIKHSYCQLDTTNGYIAKRIKKENFMEAYSNDLDFKAFLISNHQLFENSSDNNNNKNNNNNGSSNSKEIFENQRKKEKKNPKNENILTEQHINFNYNKKSNESFNNSQSHSGHETNETYVNNNQQLNPHEKIEYKNNENNFEYMNKMEKINNNFEEDSNIYPYFAKNSFSLLNDDEFNNHEHGYNNYFSKNINEKYKIVYGKELPRNINEEFDDGNKENNDPFEMMLPDNIINNFKNNKHQKNNNLNNNFNNNENNNNNLLDSEIETFRANKSNYDNENEEPVNVLKEIFNDENKNKNNDDIYNDDNLEEISKEINNPVIDKIIKYNKDNKNSTSKDLDYNINNDLDLDESSSISIPPYVENFEPSVVDVEPNQDSKILSTLSKNKTVCSKSIKENCNNNENSNKQSHKSFDKELMSKKNDNLLFNNDNVNHINDRQILKEKSIITDFNNEEMFSKNSNNNNIQLQNSSLNQNNNQIQIQIQNQNQSRSSLQNHHQTEYDNFKQKYIKRISDQKAYWPTFIHSYADPSSKEFTTSIQKKSIFSPYLQYLILLNKEFNKENGKKKHHHHSNNNTSNSHNKTGGGYIALNKDIKGSWTSVEIMKQIKKQRIINNELNLLLPLKCVVYDCNSYNKYIKKERAMYFIRLYQKLDIENHPSYVDIIIENINSEDSYEYSLLFTVPVEAFDMYICRNEKEINYHKAEVHIEHSNQQYDHFKISSIISPSNIVEFIQKLRQCRGLDYDRTLPNSLQIKNYDKNKENERKIKLINAKQKMMIRSQIQNKKEE